jgi:hypothetical protein
MLRSTKYQRLAYKLGLSLRSVNPMGPPAAAPTWYGTDSKGFSVGGTSGPVTTADKATFSSETTSAQTSANLSGPRAQGASGGNNTIAYCIGGYDTTGNPQTSANKLTHSNDTMASNASAALPAARSGIMAAVYTSAIYSYGGSNPGGSLNKVEAYKTPYSNDTTAALTSANLSTGRDSGMTVSSDSAAIYLGGFTSGFVGRTLVDKMPFSTETSANNASLVLPAAKAYGNFGSINGPISTKGFLAASSALTTWAKVTYATDTSSTVSTNSVEQSSGMSSSATGYTLGGSSGGQVTTAYKFPFSSETASTISAMNKTVAKAQSMGFC